MLTILRRINLIEPNIRVCAHLLNIKIPQNFTPVNSFSSKYTPQALKRKKSKGKDSTVRNVKLYVVFRFFFQKISFPRQLTSQI